VSCDVSVERRRGYGAAACSSLFLSAIELQARG
jgi:hypothetical protein